MSTIPALRNAVEEQHDCLATLREIGHVVHRREDVSEWDGPVAAFNLIGHPSAAIAYAWYEPTATPNGGRVHAVLHAGLVDSAEAAVRSSVRRSATDEQAS